jgi:hypothetical protein
MDAPAGLNASLLIGGDHKIVGTEGPAFPVALVQIQDRAGFFSEAGITRKDPGPMTPGADGVAAEPSPNRGTTDVGDPSLFQHLAPYVFYGKPGQR